MASHKRYVRLYRTLQFLLGPLLCQVLGFRAPRCDVPSAPYLLVSNHNTDFDPIFLGATFRQHMYFVASEHVFRRGLASKLLTSVFAPIARVKGASDAAAARSILRRLRSGANVCLFAEGNRSFNGVTGPIYPATGKLVKSAGVTLVTYRIRGGYLASPRWSAKRRRGPIEGELMNVYTPEMLRAMRPEEVNAAITRDLYEDAFARQAQQMRRYPGRRLSEYLERALYVCPVCGRIGTLKSRGDRFFCPCGLNLRYSETGFFEGAQVPFSTVRDWDVWQEERMAALAEMLPENPVFFDDNVRLLRLLDGHESEILETGRLSISAREIVCGGRSFPLASISGMALCAAARIVLSTDDGGSYELTAPPPFCGRKYMTFFEKLKEVRESHAV